MVMDRRCRLREYRDFRCEGRDRRPAFDRMLRDASRRKFDVVMSIAALERLAGADAFRPSLGLARREAVWAIGALRDRPLPLFGAAETRAGTLIAEVSESAVILRPMKFGRELVKDYNALGLTLRPHPVSFLRRDLAARGHRRVRRGFSGAGPKTADDIRSGANVPAVRPSQGHVIRHSRR